MMNDKKKYIITHTKQFEKDLIFYVKKKKCKNLIDDVRKLVNNLEQGIFQGDRVDAVGLPDGESTYKIRMADTTHKIGASGGFRIIYYVIKNDKEVFLLTIYSKRDKSNIIPKDILKLIKKYCINI